MISMMLRLLEMMEREREEEEEEEEEEGRVFIRKSHGRRS
jgi:hypothetical protein